MATVLDVKGTKSFCDDVYTELAGMKGKLVEMRDRSRKQGTDNEIVGMFERHLSELVDEIDWKIQILAHSCSYDWKGSDAYNNDVRVDEADKLHDQNFSPGYLGG
jgi:hypothetical protein